MKENRYPDEWQWRISEADLRPGVRLATQFITGEAFRLAGFDITPEDALVLDSLCIGKVLARMPYPVPVRRMRMRETAFGDGQGYIIVPANTSIEVAVRNVTEQTVPAYVRLVRAGESATYRPQHIILATQN